MNRKYASNPGVTVQDSWSAKNLPPHSQSLKLTVHPVANAASPDVTGHSSVTPIYPTRARPYSLTEKEEERPAHFLPLPLSHWGRFTLPKLELLTLSMVHKGQH